MDKTVVCSSSRNTIRTDLSLLLECLKFRMNSPELQKQALLAIHSICERREDIVDMLREMGGVAFVYNLSRSSFVHSDVKETALFTLGTLAEANVYCKNSLCRKETFAEIAGLLMQEDIPLTQKRVSVYLLSVLVANNKSGQTLAQTTGCLDILLDLFRNTFPLSTEATLRAASASQFYQLWSSVSCALCGCVNNPQNEEAQRTCVAAFPMIKIWLQQMSLPRTEIFQPICSFIAMTVANNSCVQESFSASGGLDTLTLALVCQASAADRSLLSCQISVILSKTLSACITDNSPLASGLAQYDVVYHLLFLLASPHMDPEDRLSVLLTLGHCTEASEAHQSQLLQHGGLPFVITLLTEDTSEEVRKAAQFILQTCKQATMSLGVSSLISRQEEDENARILTNMEDFRSSARELLRRIDLLEKRQAKEAKDEQEDTDPAASAHGIGRPSLPPALPLPLQQRESIKTIPTAYRQTSTLKHVEAVHDNNTELQMVRNAVKNENVMEERAETTRARVTSSLESVEGGREPLTPDTQLFNPPEPVRHSVPKEFADEEELQDREMSKLGKIPVEEHSLSRSYIRCAGCVLPFEEVTSRTFASLQSSCHHSCDMHEVLQAATERFRTRHRNLLSRREHRDDTVKQTEPDSERVSAAEPRRSWKDWSDFCLTPKLKRAENDKISLPENQRRTYKGFTLTPLRREAKKGTLTSYNKTGPGSTSPTRSHRREERRDLDDSGHLALDDEPQTGTAHCSTRKTSAMRRCANYCVV